MAIEVKVYKGQAPTGTPDISREVNRYVVNDEHVAVSVKGGLINKTILSGDLVTVIITDPQNGTVSKLCKYISYNFQVMDSAASSSPDTIADNTLLFEVIY